MCLDPETCADREGPHPQATLQQITVRGPLFILPSSVPSPGAGKRQSEESSGGKYNSQTSHTLVEVPVEVAVAIALASFLVGAMSTGVLWFLHSKAMQAKSVSTGLGPAGPTLTSDLLQRRMRAEGNELQSMLGSSSAPCGRGGDQNANINCVTCPLV